MRNLFQALAVCGVLAGCEQSDVPPVQNAASDALLPRSVYTNTVTILQDNDVVGVLTRQEDSLGDCLTKAAFLVVSNSPDVAVLGTCDDQEAIEAERRFAEEKAKNPTQVFQGGQVVIHMDPDQYGMSYECQAAFNPAAAERLREIWDSQKESQIMTLQFNPDDVRAICHTKGKTDFEVKTQLIVVPLPLPDRSQFSAEGAQSPVAPRFGSLRGSGYHRGLWQCRWRW